MNAAPEIAGFSLARAARTATVHLRVCDDASGPLVARFGQRRTLKGRTRAQAAFERQLAAAGGTCGDYALAWRVPKRLIGRGRYVVEVRVRDAEGAWSKAVTSARPARI